MTSALVSPIETYSFSASDKLFLDANVWLMVDPPSYAKTIESAAAYSGALKRILQAKSKLFVDAIVLSEVTNRWLRYSFEASDRSIYPDFKTFRRGPDCRKVARDLAASCRRILRLADRADTGFRSMNVDEILGDVESGSRDFNDGVIAATCDARGFTLVTHDADFRGMRARTLTANPRLLRR